jgi:hypothetical protein
MEISKTRIHNPPEPFERGIFYRLQLVDEEGSERISEQWWDQVASCVKGLSTVIQPRMDAGRGESCQERNLQRLFSAGPPREKKR